MLRPFHVHPNDYTRVAEQARMLQSELEKNDCYNKRTRFIIKQNLKDIEQIYSKMNDIEVMKSEHKSFESLCTFLLLKTLGCSREDIREYLFKTKNYDFDALKTMTERK